ncbi:MAG: hypothetical protein IPL12_09350 [Bacteroidetes bacterium]|nr:hypothetical protein [Bacteroidota bacterium]
MALVVPYQYGSGVWSGSYTINLNEVFHGQIPQQFTVVGKLQADSGAMVDPQTYDESSCTLLLQATIVILLTWGN